MSGYTVNPRIRWTEWLPWIIAGILFFLLPEYLALGARILIYILFALSLDLILGYAGIITLGHSAFFGLGAYVAGCLSAKAGITDPFVQLVEGGGQRRRLRDVDSRDVEVTRVQANAEPLVSSQRVEQLCEL